MEIESKTYDIEYKNVPKKEYLPVQIHPIVSILKSYYYFFLLKYIFSSVVFCICYIIIYALVSILKSTCTFLKLNYINWSPVSC